MAELVQGLEPPAPERPQTAAEARAQVREVGFYKGWNANGRKSGQGEEKRK